VQRNWNTAGAAISAAGGVGVRRNSKWAGIAGVFLITAGCLFGQAAQGATGIAQYGQPKYPPDFTHFDYANPDAPRDGNLVFANYDQSTSFDSLNPFILRGSPAPDVGHLLFDTLLQRSWDELASAYPLIADHVEVAPDKMSALFHINPAARFSNGDPITAADVKYSFDTLTGKLVSPIVSSAFVIIKRATVVDPHTVRFDFVSPDPSAPLIAGDLPIFSPKWGDLPNGKHVPFDQLSMETVIGSGPYVIDHIDGNHEITYKRLPNYWAKDLPSRRGMYNFDRVTFKLYLDLYTRLEAFKAENFDVNVEYSSSTWARKYIGKNFDNGKLKKEFFPLHALIQMQGMIFNTRRPLFQDIRVRKAIALAFDYDWMNREMFYGQYPRTDSYFENSPFKATGMPSPAELELLDPWRKYLPPSVFGPMVEPTSTIPPHSLRDNLKEARDLLAQAGWHYKDGALRNAKGEPFTFEVINDEPGMERIYSVLVRNLSLLGITMSIRDIDAALYLKRTNDFDFDMITQNYAPVTIPGQEMQRRFSSTSANEKGSENYPGVHSPAIDALLRDLLAAKTLDDLFTATHALDRALMHSWYMIPEYYQSGWRIAYASYIGHPAITPDNYQAEDWIISYWWDNSHRGAKSAAGAQPASATH
jgi:microcin C transport system substrate-binding protein